MTNPTPARARTRALQRRALTFRTGVNVACPRRFTSIPSEIVWRQLVRAADSVSNNLTEADEAGSSADFLHKIKLSLREARESKICLAKVRLAQLDRSEGTLDLEREAGELCAIVATLAKKVADRIDRENTGQNHS